MLTASSGSSNFNIFGGAGEREGSHFFLLLLCHHWQPPACMLITLSKYRIHSIMNTKCQSHLSEKLYQYDIILHICIKVTKNKLTCKSLSRYKNEGHGIRHEIWSLSVICLLPPHLSHYRENRKAVSYNLYNLKYKVILLHKSTCFVYVSCAALHFTACAIFILFCTKMKLNYFVLQSTHSRLQELFLLWILTHFSSLVKKAPLIKKRIQCKISTKCKLIQKACKVFWTMILFIPVSQKIWCSKLTMF